jgi:hypothetical protein
MTPAYLLFRKIGEGKKHYGRDESDPECQFEIVKKVLQPSSPPHLPFWKKNM